MLRSVASKVAWVGRTASMVFGLALALALVVGVASAAFGANNDNFILGNPNVATKITKLTGNVAGGPALQVVNTNTAAGSKALQLNVAANKPPWWPTANPGQVHSSPLFELPFGPPNDPQTLAQRNLLRHLTFGLPSGQRVAKEMKVEPLNRDDLSDLQPLGFDRETPLWFYILKEAELQAEGKRLGPMGGRIVAEVFVGLLQSDLNSYLQKDPNWKPTLG